LEKTPTLGFIETAFVNVTMHSMTQSLAKWEETIYGMTGRVAEL